MNASGYLTAVNFRFYQKFGLMAHWKMRIAMMIMEDRDSTTVLDAVVFLLYGN
jgi:hypothetical protein